MCRFMMQRPTRSLLEYFRLQPDLSDDVNDDSLASIE